jgi:hypothetical protein
MPTTSVKRILNHLSYWHLELLSFYDAASYAHKAPARHVIDIRFEPWLLQLNVILCRL